MSTRLVGRRLPSEHGDVVGDATKQAQDAAFINDELGLLACDASRELSMRTRDTRQLVEIDFPGGGLPPDPGHWIVLEEQLALHSHPARQFEWSMVEYQEIDIGRQQNLKRLRRLITEIRGDVDV